MQATDFYTATIHELEFDKTFLLKKKYAFEWLRLLVIVLIGCVFYFLFRTMVVVSIIAIFILLITFIQLVYADIKNKDALKQCHNCLRQIPKNNTLTGGQIW